jgi:MFS family permease
VIGAIVLVIGFCVDNYWIQWVVAVIVALSVALVYSLLITFASDEVKPHQQGLLMGAADSLLSLAFAITGFLSGILAIHNAALPELISAIFFIVAAIIFFITK